MTAAVITGASAGLGAEFTRQLVREFPDIEEFWLIARRVGKLEELAQQFPEKKFVCRPQPARPQELPLSRRKAGGAESRRAAAGQ